MYEEICEDFDERNLQNIWENWVQEEDLRCEKRWTRRDGRKTTEREAPEEEITEREAMGGEPTEGEATAGEGHAGEAAERAATAREADEPDGMEGDPLKMALIWNARWEDTGWDAAEREATEGQGKREKPAAAAAAAAVVATGGDIGGARRWTEHQKKKKRFTVPPSLVCDPLPLVSFPSPPVPFAAARVLEFSLSAMQRIQKQTPLHNS